MTCAFSLVRSMRIGQRLGAAQDQPRIHRPEDRAGGVLHELHPVHVVLVLEDDDAADAVAVAVEELRRAVQHDVGAERQRPLDVRARKRVVDDDADVLAWAIALAHWMSVMCSIGLVGVSMNRYFVFGLIAGSTSSGFEVST